MPYDLPISGQEAHVLLRAIAAYNDLPETSRLDRSTGTWIAERILRGFPGLLGDATELGVRAGQ